MASRQRRIKGTGRDSAPSLLCSVGIETLRSPWTDARGEYGDVMRSAVLMVSRRDGAHWSEPDVTHHMGCETFWEQLDSIGRTNWRVYVVAPRASDALTQLRWWDRVQANEVQIWDRRTRAEIAADQKAGKRTYKPNPLIIHGRPDIIGYRHEGHSFRWVSVNNWSDASLLDMARQCGVAVPEGLARESKWEAPLIDAGTSATICLRFLQRLIVWWIANQCGMWKDSPGAAAWSTFLRRSQTTPLLIHDDPVARRLESAACYGGRATAFFLGDIGDPGEWPAVPGKPTPSGVGLPIREPVHRYDVRAMYPTILRDERFPVRLLRVETGPSLRRLRLLSENQCLVASVRIRSDRGEIPARIRTQPAYPVGTFDTCLATPELRDALLRGEVLHCYRAAVYVPGRPFQHWAEWILSLRDSMKLEGDRVGELVVKSLANSLGGRLARRKHGWEDRPGEPPLKWWGEWIIDDGSTPNGRLMRSLCGHVQELVREEHRPGLLAACYAHLTSYGRSKMALIREALGKRGCLWQDTDGIIIPDRYVPRLEATGQVADGRYGYLQREETFTWGRLITPKHYCLDGRWVLAGIHDGFSVDDGMVSSEIVTINPVRQAECPVNASLLRSIRHVRLADIDPGVTVGSDGWYVPPRADETEAGDTTPKTTGPPFD